MVLDCTEFLSESLELERAWGNLCLETAKIEKSIALNESFLLEEEQVEAAKKNKENFFKKSMDILKGLYESLIKWFKGSWAKYKKYCQENRELQEARFKKALAKKADEVSCKEVVLKTKGIEKVIAKLSKGDTDFDMEKLLSEYKVKAKGKQDIYKRCGILVGHLAALDKTYDNYEANAIRDAKRAYNKARSEGTKRIEAVKEAKAEFTRVRKLVMKFVNMNIKATRLVNKDIITLYNSIEGIV